jgi:hypothetical protein
MGFLNRFWMWFTVGDRRRAIGKGHPDLYPIDVAKLTRELRLREEGERLGRAGVPGSDAVALTGPEMAVVQVVEKARQDYVDWAHLRLRAIEETFQRCDITSQVNRALHADEEFSRDAAALLSERQSLLSKIEGDARAAQSELSQFRSRHQLDRAPHYPTQMAGVLQRLLLVALVVVEGLLNAGFFAQGLTTGLVGGFIYAAVLAALNVLVAFFCGARFSVYVHHANPVLKVVGGVSILFWIAISGTIAMAIAHMRAAMLAQSLDAPSAAFQTLLNNTLQLDIMSWVLAAISFAFATAAFLDGRAIDDTYPGYGKIARRTALARDEYEDELAALREELEELKDSHLAALDEALNLARQSIAVAESSIGDKESAGSRLHTAFRDADNSLLALLAAFRTENQVHRGALPPPQYFDISPPLPDISLPDLSTVDEASHVSKQKELMQRLHSEVERLRARIQAAFNAQFDLLKPLGAQFEEKS